MKILYCYRYGILGGVCTQLINRLAVLTGGDDIEAHLLFKQDHGISRTLEGFPNLHFESRPARIPDLVRRHGIDVAVVIDTPEFLRVLSGVDDLPVITEVHSTLQQGLQYLHDRSWPTIGYIVPSRYMKQVLHERFDLSDQEPVEICPNCLDGELFPVVDVKPSPTRPVYCWVGKLDDHKNWRGFLEFARLLKEKATAAEFWLVGGETAPAAEEQEFLAQLDSLGLCDSARWFPRIEYRSMHRVYAAVRQSGGATIVTSKDESFGMSVLEALACGCSVVAPRVGALPEIAPGKPYPLFYEAGDYASASLLALSLRDGDGDGAASRDALLTDRPVLEETYRRETLVPKYLAAVRRLMERASNVTREQGVSSSDSAEISRLNEQIDLLRPFVPGLSAEISDPSAVLEQLRKVLQLRSFRVARLIAARDGGVRSWLRLPPQLYRTLRPRRGQ